jgi:hypothetical protein
MPPSQNNGHQVVKQPLGLVVAVSDQCITTLGERSLAMLVVVDNDEHNIWIKKMDKNRQKKGIN